MNRLNLHDGPAQAVGLAARATITATIASRLNVPGPPPAESRGLTGLAYPGLAESLWENLIGLFHSDLDRIPPLHATHEPNP